MIFSCFDWLRHDVRSPQSSHHSCAYKTKQLSPGLGNLLSTRGWEHVLQSPKHGILQHLLAISQTLALGLPGFKTQDGGLSSRQLGCEHQEDRREEFG